MECLSKLRQNEEQKKILSDAINRDPRLASVLSDIVSGKRSSGNALVRYYGRDFLSAEEGTPEYKDIASAEEEKEKGSRRIRAERTRKKRTLMSLLQLLNNSARRKGTILMISLMIYGIKSLLLFFQEDTRQNFLL